MASSPTRSWEEGKLSFGVSIFFRLNFHPGPKLLYILDFRAAERFYPYILFSRCSNKPY